MQERLRRALLVIGTPRGSGKGARWLLRSLIAVGLVLVVGVGAFVWWVVRVGPYADACGPSITSSGSVARSVNIACALEAPHIDGTFAEWTDGTSHPIPEAAGIQNALDSLGHPNARNFKPAQLMDTSLIEEIRKSGFIDKLYGRAPKNER